MNSESEQQRNTETQKLVQEFDYSDDSGYLLNLCKNSRTLYNKTLEILESQNDKNYESIYHLIKTEPEYRLLKSHSAQHTIKLACESFKSYYKALEKFYKNPKKFLGRPESPKISDKETQIVIYTNQTSIIRDQKIILSKNFYIETPNNYKDIIKHQQIRIKHLFGNKFRIGIVYEKEISPEDLSPDNFLSLDLGVVNLVSAVDTSNQEAFLIKNSRIKSIIGNYLHQTKHKKNKQKQAFKRNNRIRDYLHKVSKLIINYCLKNSIKTIVIGINKNWKQSSKLSKKVNRYFVGTAHSKLIEMLKYKSVQFGIVLEIIEESYTSKCDFLNSEPIQRHQNYSGSRNKRGLFQSATGVLLNADVNGACNILSKYLNKVTRDLQSILENLRYSVLFGEGRLLRPYRFKIG